MKLIYHLSKIDINCLLKFLNNRTVEVLYCEPKKILPNDSKQIKCSYGNVDPQDYMNKYRAIKSNERDASWKISSSSHLDIQN